MAEAPMIEQTLEMEGVLRLAPSNPVGREELEEATMAVERALSEHTLAIMDGASASANFEAGCIDIDLIVTGASASELYQKVALVATLLDRTCGLQIEPLGRESAHMPMSVQGSEMRQRTPDSADLVPA